MIKWALKFVLALSFAIVMVVIIIVNVNIGYAPQVENVGGRRVNHEMLLQLRGTGHALSSDADVEMQLVYPEGYIFLNAVHALAWIDFIQNPDHLPFREEARKEIQRAWMKINSDRGRSFFDEGLLLRYGSFYNGWCSYALAKKLQMETADERSGAEVDTLKAHCARIAMALEEAMYPESYNGGVWPADVVLCVAALALHDKLFEPAYTTAIRKWVERIKLHLDPLGMLPHSVHSNGDVMENARGSSMALMLIVFNDIDQQFALEQFKLFEAHFVDTTFGLTGVREYPRGTSGMGDIDSGPMLFGYGGAATIVGATALSLYGKTEQSDRVRCTIEALTFPYRADGRKQFLFNTLPIVDAFITWSDGSIDTQFTPRSFAMFRSWSVIVFILFATLFWLVIRRAVTNRSASPAGSLSENAH